MPRLAKGLDAVVRTTFRRPFLAALLAEILRTIGLPGQVKTPDPAIARVIAPPPVLLAGTLAIGLLLHLVIPISFVSDRRTLILLVGATLIAAGAALSAAVVRAFRAAKTPVSPGRPTTCMVSTGPYRYSRNPDYVGQMLMYIGATFAANTWWPMFLAPVVLLVIKRGVVQREERYLEAKFGREYRHYANRVRRWL
jgi:protein-S-isoprenylcysteine O-methyltransferase Ste14